MSAIDTTLLQTERVMCVASTMVHNNIKNESEAYGHHEDATML